VENNRVVAFQESSEGQTLDIDSLKREQLKLSKSISVNDSFDFDNVLFTSVNLWFSLQ